ncbi:uncharacterized protein LOC122257648 [Penaeus japonicus]|uniref:uncharacterized protein LOC122257648 n=1 Tax=Penaeus japonicus TaxID=27405 RepID=UPI001C70CE8E|nr:uncharacterized protein LOC122257648 [Penaeus japonicus]
MKKNFTFITPSPLQALYLPEEVNFWTMAIVAVGTGFILTVAVSIYLICQTSLERPLPVRHPRTVRHISQGPDAVPLARPFGSDLHTLKKGDFHTSSLDLPPSS